MSSGITDSMLSSVGTPKDNAVKIEECLLVGICISVPSWLNARAHKVSGQLKGETQSHPPHDFASRDGRYLMELGRGRVFARMRVSYIDAITSTF